MKNIPRTVFFLGLVSLFTDMASEMIYPLLPVFLSSVLGASALELGVIEGIAESTASILKIYSGVWTDRIGRRKPLVLGGYGIASLVRPLIGLTHSWQSVLGIRFIDRIGKGIRSSPRDALIADVTNPAHRGTAYGFHRSMDHAGAVIGPLVAAALLGLSFMSLRRVFLLAAIPGAVAVLVVIFFVREPGTKAQTKAGTPATSLNPLRDWKEFNREFKFFLLALFVFTLGNSTDAFLLVRLSDSGVAPGWIAGLWSLHHVIKMISSLYAGKLSDRVSRRLLILLGWLLYALIYLGFARFESATSLVVLFLLYGIYYGLTEPVERAWVSDLVPAPMRGRSFGFYHFMIGAGALPASLLFGWIWSAWGAAAAFYTGAGLAGLAALLLLNFTSRSIRS